MGSLTSILVSLAEAADALYDQETAAESVAIARRFFENVTPIPYRGLLYCNILQGNLALQREDYPAAAELFGLALSSARTCGFKHEESLSWHRFGLLNATRGCVHSALRCYIIAMAMYSQLRNMKGKVSVLVRLAELDQSMDADSSVALFRAAYAPSVRLRMARDVAACMLGLDRPQEALTLYSRTGDSKGVERCRRRIVN